MKELICPCCGKVLKVIDETRPPNDKKITVHCNKCNIDIEFEVAIT